MQKDVQTHSGTQTFTNTHANLMLEHMRTGMALYDAEEFHLLAVNNSFKLFLEEYLCPGKSVELAIGCPLITLLPQPKEVARGILNIFRTVVATGEPYYADAFPIPMVSKGLTYWQWTLDPICDASGTITHLLHSANDVTTHVLALQQAEQANISLSQTAHTIEIERKRLEVSEHQKNDFLTVANHELRTPITAILGLAEILKIWVAQQENSYSERSLHALTSIIKQSKRLTRLIEEMLDLSRIENKHLILNIAPHNLVQTLTQVIESQSITTKQHAIHFILDGVEQQNTLIGHFDEDRITQVLNNLISNAVKYSPEQTDIEVGLQVTEEKPAEALIWVRDHGIGISATELPHIYERYHRASNLDRSISGLGVGLYLVDELVTQHGGRVWVESSEGNGSIFYVNLPLVQPS